MIDFKFWLNFTITFPFNFRRAERRRREAAAARGEEEVRIGTSGGVYAHIMHPGGERGGKRRGGG